MTTRGFTLIEIVVAVSLLSIVIGAAFTFLASGIRIQRQSVGNQALIDQTSFLAEYISRSVRQAQKSSGGGGCPPDGWNYELVAIDKLEFRDRAGTCRTLSLNTSSGYGKIEEKKGPTIELTGSDIDVLGLTFVVDGEAQTDDRQPRVTFVIHAKAKGSNAEIFFQTTVSQRDFDVQQ
jgi:prepilin-type N-terminal cleavage/methylation domain-containing protein